MIKLFTQKYFIEDDKEYFLCNSNKFIFWSNYKTSLNVRIERIYIFLLPLFFLIRISGISCTIVKVK